MPPPNSPLCALPSNVTVYICTHLFPVENVNEVPRLLFCDLGRIQILANVLEPELIVGRRRRPGSFWGERMWRLNEIADGGHWSE